MFHFGHFGPLEGAGAGGGSGRSPIVTPLGTTAGHADAPSQPEFF